VKEAVIRNEDCLAALKSMDDEIFDLIVSDPPYMEYKTSHRKDKESKLSQPIIYQDQKDQVETIKECLRVLKTGRAFFLFTNWQNIWWMQQPFQSFMRNMIVWKKNNWSAGDLKGSFGNQHEIIFLLTKGSGWTYKGKRESDIWEFNRVGNNRIHPTEKPVELYKKIIENATDEGALILDPYGGSGSSAEAALALNRNIIVYEIDKEYHAGIERRLDALKHST
jgi:site-specific DNA-methyltransferase (adenine-specific)